MLLVIAIAALAIASCKKDEEVNTTLAAVDFFTAELISRIETAANPSAGVDDARRYFDLTKPEIVSRMTALRSVPGYQVSDATKEKMTSRLVDDSSRVGGLQVKYASQSMNDPEFKARLDKLVKDYQSLFRE